MKKFRIGNMEGNFTEHPTFALHENESMAEILGGKVGFSFAFGRVKEFGKIGVSKCEKFPHRL